MRERTQQINFRVTKTEKEKIHRKAKRCGMTDADYIRNCALDRKIMEIPRDGLMKAYLQVNPLLQYLEQYDDDLARKEIAALKAIQETLLDLYHGKEIDDDGSDKDLDGNG